jgi:hypothetical protein
MKSNPFAGISHPPLPTLSDIQRRIAELTSVQQQLDKQTQLQTPPTPPTPPPPSVSPAPILADAALYGVAGLAVCGLAPHSEAHPAAMLLQLLAAFGNAVGPAPHCMDRWVQSTKPAGLPGAAPLPSGLPYQNRSAWPGKSHTLNRQLRKQPTRNQCRSRLSSLSSLSSHISTGELDVNVLLREQPMRNQCMSTC